MNQPVALGWPLIPRCDTRHLLRLNGGNAAILISIYFYRDVSSVYSADA
jgi:hypothetical protein